MAPKLSLLARVRQSPDSYFNSLWNFLYSALILAAGVYFMYEFYRTAEIRLKEPRQNQAATFYICHAAAASGALFTLMAAGIVVIKIGNYANDSQKLGKLVARVVRTRFEPSGKTPSFLEKVHRHGLPTGCLCHLVAGFLQLLPSIIVENKVDAGTLPSTHLDWLLPRPNSAGQNSPARTGLYQAQSVSLAGNTTEKPGEIPVNQLPDISALQFANVALALLLIAIRYPSVFWFTNKMFAGAFALFTLVSWMDHVTTLTGVTLLYRLKRSWLLVETTGLGSELHLGAGPLLGVFVICQTLVLSSAPVVFVYGHRHYYEFYRRCLERFVGVRLVESAEPKTNGCYMYTPNIVAMILLIVIAVGKAPIIYDYIAVYRISHDPLLLTCILVDCIFVMTWILLWFIFTLKQNWAFHIQLPYNPQKFLLNDENAAGQRPADDQDDADAESRLSDLEFGPAVEHAELAAAFQRSSSPLCAPTSAFPEQLPAAGSGPSALRPTTDASRHVSDPLSVHVQQRNDQLLTTVHLSDLQQSVTNHSSSDAAGSSYAGSGAYAVSGTADHYDGVAAGRKTVTFHETDEVNSYTDHSYDGETSSLASSAHSDLDQPAAQSPTTGTEPLEPTHALMMAAAGLLRSLPGSKLPTANVDQPSTGFQISQLPDNYEDFWQMRQYARRIGRSTSPDNTLKRDYRYSLRNSCSQYVARRDGLAALVSPGGRQPASAATARPLSADIDSALASSSEHSGSNSHSDSNSVAAAPLPTRLCSDV